MINFLVTTFWFLRTIKHHNHTTFMNQKVVTENFIIELTGDKYFSFCDKTWRLSNQIIVTPTGSPLGWVKVSFQNAFLVSSISSKKRTKTIFFDKLFDKFFDKCFNDFFLTNFIDKFYWQIFWWIWRWFFLTNFLTNIFDEFVAEFFWRISWWNYWQNLLWIFWWFLIFQ